MLRQPPTHLHKSCKLSANCECHLRSCTLVNGEINHGSCQRQINKFSHHGVKVKNTKLLSAVISRWSRSAIISAALWACFEIMFGVEVYFFRFHHWPKKTEKKKIYVLFFALRIVTSDAVYFWAQTQTLQCNLFLSPFNPSLRFANTGWVVFSHTYMSFFFFLELSRVQVGVQEGRGGSGILMHCMDSWRGILLSLLIYSWGQRSGPVREGMLEKVWWFAQEHLVFNKATWAAFMSLRTGLGSEQMCADDYSRDLQQIKAKVWLFGNSVQDLKMTITCSSVT